MPSSSPPPATSPPPERSLPAPPTSPSDGWKERIIIPTLLASVIGGGIGLISKRRKSVGTAAVAGSYAVDFAMATGCYCGLRELARDARASEPDDLMNSAIGGFASGALLGRLQGGQLGAIKYSILFAAGGTALDFATIQLRPHFENFKKTVTNFSTEGWQRLPEWSPIQVLDEEALAAKRAREQQLENHRPFSQLNNDKP